MVGITDTGGALVTVAAFSGTQQIDVIDNDTATVSIATASNGSEQGPVNGVFTLTQTQISTADTVVSYSTGGTATSGSDYVALSGSVTIPAGGTTATIIVPVIDDTITDPNETVIVTLTGIVAGNNGVTLDPAVANRTATLTIADNDNATSIDLADASDTGPSNTDNITRVTTPTLNGTAPANASVVVTDSGNVIGTTTASNAGTWSVVSAPLAEGVHNLLAQATLGPSVTTSPVLTVTIDTQTSTPIITGINSDNGSSASDGITNVGSFFLNGTAEKNSAVDVFQVGTKLGTAIANAAGNWTFNVVGPLADGASVFYTTQSTDLAGNSSAFSAPFNVHIDTQPPPTPTQPDLIPGSDHGVSNTDNLTNVATPTFTSGGEVGSTITLFEGGAPIGSGVVGSTGIATITTSTLTDGVHNITAQSTDVAGNQSGQSTALTVTIDTVPPNLSPLDLINSSDSGVSNSDNITNVAQPTVSGTSDPAATINILDGANVIASTTAGPGGGFQVVLPILSNGAHNLSARTFDSAGNLATTPLLIVTIDTIPPATPSKPVLAAASDSGSSNSDQITNITSVQISGTAEPGATVLIFDGPRCSIFKLSTPPDFGKAPLI